MGALIMIVVGFILLAYCIKVGIDNSKLAHSHKKTTQTLEQIKELLIEMSNDRQTKQDEA